MAIIERNIFVDIKTNRLRMLAVGVLWVLACLCNPLSVHAQSQNTLILDGKQPSYNITPYSYLTIDQNKDLTSEIIIKNHNEKLRGKKPKTDIINLDDTEHSVWILFSVYNQTNSDDWVLHFGNTLDGRMGMIKTIRILNHDTKQTISIPSSSKETSDVYLGSALSLNIKPNMQNTFVIEIEPEKGLPLVFVPKIIAQKTYMQMLLQGNIKNIIAALLFIAIISFFLTSFHIGKNKASIALLSYYAVLCALFFNLDAYAIPVNIINGAVLFWLYMSSFMLLVIATKFFAKLTYDLKPMENIALVILTLLMTASVLLYIFVFSASTMGLLIVTSTIGLCLVLLSTIVFFTSDKPASISCLFSIALLSSGAALTLLTIISLGYVEPGYVTYFWYAHLFQALCFMGAYLRANIHRNERKKNEIENKTRDDHSLARLQKSKDSADQARLLRVIERERELMSELREREIKRTEEMRHSKEIADKANQAKSAFLAVVSHEIRTPMNGIMGMVQLLQTTSLSKTQSDYVDTIRRSGDTMMALLNDILDFEKIERGSMEVETVNFDLHKLVQDIIILMSGHASQKNLALKSDIGDDVPNVVSGDPTRLRQVLLNLVNNGLKFTEDGEVSIKVTTIELTDTTKVRFEVKDTGIGISDDAQTKLFTPFTQAETSISRKYGGTGLGLAISYRLIEAMGGKIQVDSAPENGSTFFFDLPMIVENNNVLNDQSFFDPDNVEQHKTKPMRILVAEDNEMNRKVIDGLLTQQGHTLFMAANGLEALDLCREHHPDLILMDIQMDGLSGLDTTKKLRADPDNTIAKTPVIALTGNVMLEDIEDFFAAGMNGFIAKPIDSNQLNEVLYNASIGKFENDIKEPESKVHEAPPLPTPKKPEDKGINLQNVATDLSLDDREHYVSDSKVKNSNNRHASIIRDNTVKADIKKKERIAPIVSTPAPVDVKKEDKNPAFEETKITKTVIAQPNPMTEKSAKQEGTKKPAFRRDAPDDEMTEIQRYLMQQHSSNKDGDTTSEEEPQTEVRTMSENRDEPSIPTPDDNPDPTETKTEAEREQVELLDHKMLKSLIDTLGKDQFTNLLQGFLEKATEIIEDLEANVEENNISALGARAHELKGMAGNFGMKHVSDLAGKIEKAAKLSQNDDAIKTAQKLSAANDETRAALLKWADQ